MNEASTSAGPAPSSSTCSHDASPTQSGSVCLSGSTAAAASAVPLSGPSSPARRRSVPTQLVQAWPSVEVRTLATAPEGSSRPIMENGSGARSGALSTAPVGPPASGAAAAP
jgi:hypothetical protein